MKTNNQNIQAENIKQQIIALQGCPGSGKSRMAHETFSRHWATFKIVNLDDIRFELTGNPADQSRNADVVRIALERTEQHLKDGWSVVFDSTLSKREYLAPLEAFAKKYNVGLEVFFVKVSLATAQERNAMRDRVVPANIVEIIYNMIAKFDYRGLRVTVVDNE